MKNIVSFFLVFLSTVFITCLLSGRAEAQIQFQRAIGGASDELANSVIQTSDGGYIMAGGTSSFGAGGSDMYFVKLDFHGNLQWTKTVGTPGNDEAMSIVQTSDGGYVALGLSNTPPSPVYKIYLVKLDGSGNLLWTKYVPGINIDIGAAGNSLIKTSDGGFAIAGTATVPPNEVYIIKLDMNANLQWSETIGGNSNDMGKSIVQTNDGGYAVAGYTNSFGAGSYDMYIIKLNSGGNLTWSRTVGGPHDDFANSIIQAADGGYTVCGHTNSFQTSLTNYDMYIVKLNSSGNLTWTRTINSTNYGLYLFTFGSQIIQKPDGSYMIAGSTNGWADNSGFLVHIDASSNLLWSRTIGGPGNGDALYALIKTSDGGMLTAGQTHSFGAGQYDMYVVKIDQSNYTCANDTLRQSSTGTGGVQGNPNSVVVPRTPTIFSANLSSGTAGTFTWVCTKFPLIPKPIILGLISQVQYFVNTGILNEGNGNSLGVKLDAAIRSIDNGQNDDAINHLDNFNNHLDVFVNSGKLTEEEALPLTTSANDAITLLRGRSSRTIQETAKEFSLEQNYPNPFNPSTTIKFRIPADGIVTLKIYDILGKEVATLVNEKLTAGDHEAMFDASELASGVYLYKIESGSYKDIKKMLLIK